MYGLGNQQPSIQCKAPVGVLGWMKVQRLGGEETILRPRAPGPKKRDDIVWAFPKWKEGRHKQATANKTVIYNISPEDCPFISSVGRENVSNTYFEHQTDALSAASTSNAVIEGDEATLDARAATNRVGNYTQISRKVIGVSGTVEAVDKAGMRSYLAYELAKASSELKTDMEATMLFNQAAAVGSSTVARKTAGLPAWLRTNVNKAGNGGNPTMSSTNDGYPNAGRTDGTQRTFTETMLKDVIQQVWTQGGDPKVCMMGPYNKTVASGFAGIAANRVNQTSGSPKAFSIIATADIYMSDFGKVAFVANRYQRTRDVFILDPEYASVAYLRNFRTEDLSRTGDSSKKMLLVEYGLKVKTEKAHGIIADLTTS